MQKRVCRVWPEKEEHQVERELKKRIGQLERALGRKI
jgi:hypothetical protein